MEDSSYTSLKHSLCSVPAKALKHSTRLKLSNDLNIKIVLPSKSSVYRDYRGLAELMGFQYSDTKNFERHEDPTIKILEAWETDPNAMLDKLIDYLIEMERHDVIKELSPLLERDAKSYLQRQKSQEIPIQVPEVTSCPVGTWSEDRGSKNELPLTIYEVINGECAYYDAYVSYADDDIRDVRLLADYLESPDIGLKLYIRARDMLAGCPELATNIELIKNRCRRMLIILTSNYLKSPECEFQTSFAASLAIDQSRRMLIPVIIEPCEVPLILKYVSKIDFTKPGNNSWDYAKLINSLLPEHRTPMFLSSPEKSLKQICPPKLRSLGSFENTPAISFPSSGKQSSDTRDNTVAEVSSENTLKDSSSVSSKSKKWRLQLYNRLKKGHNFSSRYSTSDSTLSSSSATSGFHSQSSNTLEDFESLIESSSDTPL